MVAVVVFDEEVAVGALGQGDLGQPFLQFGVAVAQLVGGVDAQSAEQADGHGQADLVRRLSAGSAHR